MVPVPVGGLVHPFVPVAMRPARSVSMRPLTVCRSGWAAYACAPIPDGDGGGSWSRDRGRGLFVRPL